jgi:GT2 family glycosyltransferase
MWETRPAPQTVSVVIPAYDAANTIADQLAALERQTYTGDREIIVADNGSQDGIADVVLTWRARLPYLRVVDAGDRSGAAHARNVGAAAASGDLLAFCDADDIVGPRWLEALARAALSNDAVGGKMAPAPDGSSDRWRWRAIPDAQLKTTLRFLPYTESANLAVWRDVFEEVGGFPLYPGAAGEDVAFCWRMQLRGFRLGYAPDARVARRPRTGVGPVFRQWHAYGMAQARVYKEFRPYGAERRSVAATLRAWLGLVRHLGDLVRGRHARESWIGRFAFESGQLRGAVRHRVLFTG